jgi:phosphatidylserine decarboxylase
MINETHKIAPEGYRIILVSALVAAGLFYLNIWAGLVGAVWTIFCLAFFRSPKRVTPTEAGLLIAPADGKVVFVGKAMEPHLAKAEMTRVSIFMSPFNVHVNRAPASGTVTATHYQKGKFLAAFDERAATDNEQSAVRMTTVDGHDIIFKQVAGWFARRIVSYAKTGQPLERGKLFGLIKFSSRMDVYFTDGYVPVISVGAVVKAGESILAKLKGST